jgi:hypothetical protein
MVTKQQLTISIWQLCTKIYVATVWGGVDISLTVHSREIFKIVKSTCNDIKKCQLTPLHYTVPHGST